MKFKKIRTSAQTMLARRFEGRRQRVAALSATSASTVLGFVYDAHNSYARSLVKLSQRI